jgi:hypothetical protein
LALYTNELRGWAKAQYALLPPDQRGNYEQRAREETARNRQEQQRLQVPSAAHDEPPPAFQGQQQ